MCDEMREDTCKTGVARALARRPALSAGLTGFAILFGGVAINAMHQPGPHPSPFLATREPGEGAPLARRRLRRSTTSAATKNSTTGQLAGSAIPSYKRVASVETSAVDDSHAASTDGRTA